MASSAMGAQIGGSAGFLLTAHVKTNASTIFACLWCFTRVYLHTQTAVDVSDIRTKEPQLFW